MTDEPRDEPGAPDHSEHDPKGRGRWCDQHRRWECTKRRQADAAPCHAVRIEGLDACRKHSGLPVAVAKAKGRAALDAFNATVYMADYDGPVIDPAMALLGLLHMSWLRVAQYGELLRRQVEVDGVKATEGVGETGLAIGNGLIGHKYGAGGRDGVLYAQSEEARGLVKLEGEERDRCARYARDAETLGIARRHIELQEAQARAVAAALAVALGESGLDGDAQDRAQRRFLQSLAELVPTTGGKPEIDAIAGRVVGAGVEG